MLVILSFTLAILVVSFLFLKYKKPPLAKKSFVLKEEIVELDEQTKRLMKYQRLGTVEEINQALDVAEKLLTDYKALGSPDEIERCFNRFGEMLEKWKKGELPEINSSDGVTSIESPQPDIQGKVLNKSEEITRRIKFD